MLRKILSVAAASAFLVVVGVPETPFAPESASAATKCRKGMKKNWRGKCVRARIAKARPRAKAKPHAKSYLKNSPANRRKGKAKK